MSLTEDILDLFGLQIKHKDSKQDLSGALSVDQDDDGSSIYSSTASLGNAFGTYLDIDGATKTEIEAIRKYREIALFAEVDVAIQEVINEAIPQEQDTKMVKIDLDKLEELSDGIKQKIQNEFDTILGLLNYDERAADLFKMWYIDGRLPFQVIVDKAKLTDGIQKLILLNAQNIKKIKEVTTKKTPEGATVIDKVDEYYLYNESGFGTNKSASSGSVASGTSGVKISTDAIIYVPSGLVDNNSGMMLSYLHKAIRPINQLRMLEDATVVYFIARAPERRIFYVDVGQLPKLKAEQYMKDIMNRYRNKMVYDSKTGDVRNDKKYMCLAMDTRVPLLDGRTLSIAEIAAEHNQGKTLWAYSCDPKTGEFAPGLITWAGVTKKNAEVMRLTLDNGKSIVCTLDHKFPVWNKGFVEAKDLSVGESMVPFYTREASINGSQPYNQIFENSTKEWRYTHRLVSEWKDSLGIENEFVFNEETMMDKKKTVHHKNYNKHDNTPENLVRMNVSEPNLLSHWQQLNSEKVLSPKQKSFENFIASDINRIVKFGIGVLGYNQLREQYQHRNHKITKIEFLDEKIDTGCITIDGNEDYHNYHTFALDVGIYCKNSMLEDYFMPRRDGGKGTEITTLAGAQNITGYLDSLEWFKEKMYESLNIPKSRLQSEGGFNLGRSTEVSRDEVKFQKFIDRLRNKFSQLLLDTLRIQLILKGICNSEEWEDIKPLIKFDFQRDNFFTELKNQEILQSRFTMIQQVDNYLQKYVSKEWVQKNVLMLTDDDIAQMDREISSEASDDSAQPDWKIQGQFQMDQQQDAMQGQGGFGQPQQQMPPGQPTQAEPEYDVGNYLKQNNK